MIPRSHNQKIFIYIAGLLMVLGLIPLVLQAEERVSVMARWVADGDTIVLQDGRHIRYVGIDAPEIDHPNQPAEPWGAEARSANRQLVEGWPLHLVYDQEKKDHYGRALAYVYREDGLFVNAELVRQGYAHVRYHFPNTGKNDILLNAQREAMTAHRGIWQSIDKNNKSIREGYRGNRRSKRFHSFGCPMGKKIAKGNQIGFENVWAAFWAGYAPARECIRFPVTH